MRTFALTAALLLAVLCTPAAHAWNATGHMVIAALAYDQLSPATRQKVDAVLAQHPSYQTWKQEWGQDPAVTIEAYVFMQAACWPDEIRESDPKNLYNHPRWHYVNYPLVPPDFARHPRPDPDDDVIFAIEQAQTALAAEATVPEDCAAWLSWLQHAIGEIHQPEHCVAYFGPPYEATGDRGGNWFFVKGKGRKPINLHALWDGLAGWDEKPAEVLPRAAALAQDPLLSRTELGEPEDSSGVSAETWAEQTRVVAVECAYLRGDLRPSPPVGWEPGTGRAIPPAQAYPLPDDYLTQAESTAGRCVRLAAYRLHDRLEKLLR